MLLAMKTKTAETRIGSQSSARETMAGDLRRKVYLRRLSVVGCRFSGIPRLTGSVQARHPRQLTTDNLLIAWLSVLCDVSPGRSRQPRNHRQPTTDNRQRLSLHEFRRQPLHHLPELSRAEAFRERLHHLLHLQVLLEQ